MIILTFACPFHYILCYTLFPTYDYHATIYSTNITYLFSFCAILVYIWKIDKIPHVSTNNLFLGFKE